MAAEASAEGAASTVDLHCSDPQQSPPLGSSLQKDAAAEEEAPAAGGSSSITTDLLTFAEVSSGLSDLTFDPKRNNINNGNGNGYGNNVIDGTNRDNFGNDASPISETASPGDLLNLQQQQQLPRPPSPQPHSAASAARKPSPGLAARLKALGFGVPKKTASPTTTTPPPNDQVGRLDEDQLRQLDEKHRANSLSSAIARRGRPWKGTGATLAPHHPQHTSETRDRSRPSSAHSDPASALAPSPSSSILHLFRPRSPTLLRSPLSETNPPELRAMDTQKYRLPDHTNGNGTKVTLDTRREHIERDPIPITTEDGSVQPPPAPPPKDSPPAATPPATTDSGDYFPGLGSYFTPGHNRPGSIYTLSRASFANQLAQLTSLQLPDAESLSSKVSAIPTAQVAAKALINAAEQIRSWISKASEVIGGLDGEDDVEWSAAGGREGLAEVENAISRFEELINVYVGAIEELQGRDDIANVSPDDLRRAVSQMEAIIAEWAKIRATLQTVRAQVEIAMEWEELWNNVLGDIQGEMDELSRLVFEMEERRHKSIAAAASGEGVDIGDLETIVEDTPPHTTRLQAHKGITIPTLPMSPSSPGTPGLSQDDSSLLALFARMQPLRASLDFLPMRLSVFQARAEKSFPTACEELEMRRDGLDASYKKLEKDAESLRKELGEDRWVIVFRGAGRQAQKMHESVERSMLKLKEAIDAGLHVSNPPGMMKKMESYEAKKTHYGPAIERILSIIDKGVKDRLTVNGEILRLHADLETRWMNAKELIKDMDATVEELHMDQKGQHLRDSISSMLSNDRSTLGSGHETPGSSPPSSVIMSSLGMEPYTPVPKHNKTRSSSVHSHAAAGNRRHSSLPAPATATGRKPVYSRLSTVNSTATTPVPASRIQRPGSTTGHRPAWNGSTNTTQLDTGHNFKPLSLTTPSPYSKRSPLSHRSASSVTPSSSGSRLPMLRSPLARSASESPKVDETPTRTGHSRLSFRERLASPGPYAQQTLAKTPRLSTQISAPTDTSNRRASLQPPRSVSATGDRPGRPASSLASSTRRTSLFPSKGSKEAGNTGRTTPLSRLGLRKKDPEQVESKPRWR